MKRNKTFFTQFCIFLIVFCLQLIHEYKNYIIGEAEMQNVCRAKAECVIEVNSRRILYADNAEAALPMASTTKILTCITVLDTCPNLQEIVKIPQCAVGIEGSSVYLKAGDSYTVEELLYGLMLRSGNDCAVALALHCSKSIADFSAKMNLIAQKAGAIQSNFVNPHGLPNKEHYTTAKDLGLITCYAMENPVFRNIVATEYYGARSWKNKNKMLRLYDGGIGVKTGYTREAGRCLVSAAKRGNTTVICVVLNCPSTYERSAQLLDDAFNAYEYLPLVKAGETVSLNNGKQAKFQQSYYYPVRKEELELLEIKTNPYRCAQQEIIGQFQIYIGKWLLFSGNLYKL